MLDREYFTHYPSRLLWSGGGILCAFAILSGAILLPVADQPALPLPPRKIVRSSIAQTPIILDLDNSDHRQMWEMPSIEDEISVSISPPSPLCEGCEPLAHVRLKSAQQSKRVSLPGRIYLCFNDRGILSFQEESGAFWIDLSMEGNENLALKVSISDQGNEVLHAQFCRLPDPPPLQKADEFPPASPLRLLGEARWHGVDLVAELDSAEPRQRLLLGPDVFEMGETDWIGWENGKWIKIFSLADSKTQVIAKIRSISPQVLEWDVWDPSHARIAILLQPISPVHIKTDEWMNAVRIRSDKQMSCSIEKQSVIIRVGEWVIKENGRWRVLRKADDRKQFLNGLRNGELFVLEKIDFKQKSIKGKLYLANRTQMIPIEAFSSSQKHDRKFSSSQMNQRSRAGKGP